MKSVALALVGALVVLAGERTAAACAGCSNPGLPGARGGGAALAPGEVSVALSLTATTMKVVHSEYCPDIGPICRARPEPPQLHDQQFYVAELRPIVAVGITDVVGVELQVPIRLIRTTITFRRLDGTPFEPDYENIHHRDETLFGLADPWLLLRTGASYRNFSITSRAGLGVPLGSTEEDPFARGRAGLPHEHIQFGTGTVHPVFGLDASLRLGRVGISGYAQTVLFPFENQHGYQAGNRYSGGLTGDVEVVKNLRIGAGADLLNEQPERWGGLVQQDGNVGRTDLLVGGSLAYAFGAVTASLSVRVPVWQRFIEASHHLGDPGQLTYPAVVGLSVQRSFGGSRKAPAKAGAVLARRE